MLKKYISSSIISSDKKEYYHYYYYLLLLFTIGCVLFEVRPNEKRDNNNNKTVLPGLFGAD